MERQPTLEDVKEMNYTNAVLEESFRVASFAFGSVPHCTSAPIDIAGYNIPANTLIIGNLFHIMNDPEHFKDPMDFNPNRFLDADGVFHKSERVIPFSIGKRYCLGQSLAEKEFFLFFTGLVQAFKAKAPAGQKLPSYRADDVNPLGFTRSCPSYLIELEPRS